MPRQHIRLVNPIVEKGKKRYGVKRYRPEVVSEVRKTIDEMRIAIERYLIMCDILKWSKLYPLNVVVRRFYTKFQLHFQGLAVSSIDDSVKNGISDPRSFVENKESVEVDKKWAEVKRQWGE